ncbi:DUF2207 domain-containing protein [Clostridium tertium]|uniref:DUF2207 domain-containing protein n=1 Tax=Clostridium tertium TaxID=1559 RepID=A0A6N3EUH0_9CLOT
MRRVTKTILTIFISIFIIFFLSTTVSVKADDEDYSYDPGYYIKNINVNVEVNDKKQCMITETIDMFFKEPIDLITQTIELNGVYEEWTISDVYVDGQAIEVREDSRDAYIEINNSGVSGNKRYVISYTLNYYENEVPDGDYFRLNLLGDLNARVEKFKVEIVYPTDGKIEDLNLGEYVTDSKETDLAKYSLEDNKIIIESIKPINIYDDIVIKAKFNDGLFKNAPVKKYPYIVNKDIMNININKAKEYLIERRFEIVVNSAEVYPYDDYIILWKGDFADIVSEIDITETSMDNSKIEVFDGIYIRIPKEKGTYKFIASYKVTPDLKGDQKFIFKMQSGYYWLNNLEVNINSEIPILSNEVTLINGYGSENEGYTLKTTDNTLAFKVLGRIYPEDTVAMTLKSDSNLFVRENIEAKTTIAYTSGAVVIISILMFLIFKEKKYSFKSKYNSFDEFNSAELAFAYKNSISAKDIISLINNWAAEGYLSIEVINKDEFTITRIKDLEGNHKNYEINLFNALFKYENKITSKNLKSELIDKEIKKAMKAVKSEFKRSKKLISIFSVILSIVLLGISFIPINQFHLEVSKFSLYTYSESLNSVVMYIPILITIYSILFFNNKAINDKRFTAKNIINTILVCFIYIGFILYEMSASEVNVQFSTLLSVTIAPVIALSSSVFILKRSTYGREILDKILAYKNFLNGLEDKGYEVIIEDCSKDHDLNIMNERYIKMLNNAKMLDISNNVLEKFNKIECEKSPYYSENNKLTINEMIDIVNKSIEYIYN